MKRKEIMNAKRIVIKIGSSSLTHKETGDINYAKLEQLARVLADLRSQGKELILVSSGAQAVGRQALQLNQIPREMAKKQALAAIGQAKLMTNYQRLFAEYNIVVAQVLMTKYTVLKGEARDNACNTFSELLAMGVIPIVNENDTVATHEIEFGDNDHLSAFVVALIDADALIILSDIDGFYTDDPNTNPTASLISHIEQITDSHLAMGKETSSSTVGTGGMHAKIDAAKIVTEYGACMVLANGHDVRIIQDITTGSEIGTYFAPQPTAQFRIEDYL
ncbi:glutamate 5-kinase [Erysipelothrix sp. HDW6C]|uniref:glutamate 5-kinase n=1 Tax=Erysipelothrix sp. HDW6C TaxID=2714930 RepID=UPI00140BF005|nr:glutamate 5-kinase [Erysipelothrix sp. HDW6C]QIK69941.1 glutamate 5-kinase [Erysipelothrix sp. HDW6C]